MNNWTMEAAIKAARLLSELTGVSFVVVKLSWRYLACTIEEANLFSKTAGARLVS